MSAPATTLRAGRPADAPALTALARRAKAHWGYSAGQLAAWAGALAVPPRVLQQAPSWIAERGGVVAGYALLRRDADGRWWLDDLFVDAPAIGTGVGRLLLAAAIDGARAQGADRLWIDADPHAAGFYLAAGATRIGEIPAPIDDDPRRVRPQLVLPCRHAPG